jgi:hypothetical protein
MKGKAINGLTFTLPGNKAPIKTKLQIQDLEVKK